MTRDVIIGLVDDSLDYIMDLITERRIGHLPILDKGKLMAIISIGDVVKTRTRLAEVDIRYLTDYIKGSYPT
jgi:CBS domain-containing protein